MIQLFHSQPKVENRSLNTLLKTFPCEKSLSKVINAKTQYVFMLCLQ